MPLGEPLDGAEKRRSKGTSPSMLGVGPGHPRLGHPFPRRFSDLRRRAARRIRWRSTFPGPNEYSESGKVVPLSYFLGHTTGPLRCRGPIALESRL
jgi:hypothetical protein